MSSAEPSPEEKPASFATDDEARLFIMGILKEIDVEATVLNLTSPTLTKTEVVAAVHDILKEDHSNNPKPKLRQKGIKISMTKPPGHSCVICNTIHDLKRCSICKNIYYCSNECQLKDWRRHRQECHKQQ